MTMEDEIHDLRLRTIRLEGQMAYLYRHLDVAMSDEGPAGGDPMIAELIKNGDMVEAAERYDKVHNCGLAEARRIVQEIQKRPGT